MRMIWPTGSAYGPNRLSTTVLPSTATLAPVATSDSVKQRAAGGRPVADDEVVGRGALHLGVPVLPLGHRPGRASAAAARRARPPAPRRGWRVRSSQVRVGWLPAPPRTPPARLEPERTISMLRAHRLERLLDPRLGARADRDHRDHRADADDDAERGQERAHLVAQERAHRDRRGRVAAGSSQSSTPPGAAIARWPGAAPAPASRRPDEAVAHLDHARGVRGDVRLVGDQHHRDAARRPAPGTAP